MRWPWPKAPFPLLGKELVEQAARRRTYWVRGLYAAGLFGVFLVFSYDALARSAYAVARMGVGEGLFDRLVWIQTVGIFLFQPALMSGALTSEKERRSLELLLLTDLRPREILLQKYLGRLVPMFTFLLLSLPLLAMCYAYGGMTVEHLVAGVYSLFLLCLQVGALALLCSVWCRTTLESFIASYVLLVAVYVLGARLCLCCVPFGIVSRLALVPTFLIYGARSGGLGTVLASGVPALGSVVALLLLARVYLLRRAFLQPRNTLLAIFGVIDRFFESLNQAFGGIVLVRDKESEPGDQPIAWREVKKRSLGKARYLFRILVLLEIPTGFLALMVLVGGARSVEGLSAMLCIVWVLAALGVMVISANAVVSERTQQTLDVLLTAPMTGRAILRQKLRGVRRLIGVLLIPFLTIFLVEAWWKQALPGHWRREDFGALPYLLLSLGSVAIYLPLLSWLGLWISLRVRTRFRAIITALVALVVWVVGPYLLLAVLEAGLDVDLWSPVLLLALVSPATSIFLVEGIGPGDALGEPWLALVSYAVYGIALLILRAMCLGNADRYLGRAARPEPPPEVIYVERVGA